MPYSGRCEQSRMHKRFRAVQTKEKFDLCDEYGKGSSSSIARHERIRQEDRNNSQFQQTHQNLQEK